MFRLNDAVRRYRAQHRSPTELRCVAATATTLSPRANPDAAGIVATVAAVATSTSESIDLARLIEQLQEEGALLQHSENALLIRPAHWGQLDSVSGHWKALLLHLAVSKRYIDWIQEHTATTPAASQNNPNSHPAALES